MAALDGFLAALHDDQRRAEGLQAAWLGKGRGLVPRLAGVLHLLEWSAARAADPTVAVGEIGRDTVERAIALWSGYFRPHARAFFDHAAPSDLEARARRVVRWLQTCGAEEVSREDVRRTALGQTVNANEADRVLARLTEGGVLRSIAPGRPSPRGGRPALRWQVNPGLRGKRGATPRKIGVAQTAGTAETSTPKHEKPVAEIAVRQAKLARSSRWKSGAGKGVASSLVASVARVRR